MCGHFTLVSTISLIILIIDGKIPTLSTDTHVVWIRHVYSLHHSIVYLLLHDDSYYFLTLSCYFFLTAFPFSLLFPLCIPAHIVADFSTLHGYFHILWLLANPLVVIKGLSYIYSYNTLLWWLCYIWPIGDFKRHSLFTHFLPCSPSAWSLSGCVGSCFFSSRLECLSLLPCGGSLRTQSSDVSMGCSIRPPAFCLTTTNIVCPISLTFTLQTNLHKQT